MNAKPAQGCVAPAQGPLTARAAGSSRAADAAPANQEENLMTARVGQPAPDFEASAYFAGDFRNIKLSDYKGRWVTLCFYPGDFTFV